MHFVELLGYFFRKKTAKPYHQQTPISSESATSFTEEFSKIADV